jgi:hypothetical protein
VTKSGANEPDIPERDSPEPMPWKRGNRFIVDDDEDDGDTDDADVTTEHEEVDIDAVMADADDSNNIFAGIDDTVGDLTLFQIS